MDIFHYRISNHSTDQLVYIMSVENKAAVQSAVAHFYVREYIAKKYNIDHNDVKLKITEHGKPYYNSELHFNISHSGDHIVCAFSSSPIGVDIEYIRPIKRALIRRVMSDYEKVNYNDFDIEFLKIWTAKEAYFKFTGTGINDLKSVTRNSISQKHNLITNITDKFVFSVIY